MKINEILTQQIIEAEVRTIPASDKANDRYTCLIIILKI